MWKVESAIAKYRQKSVKVQRKLSLLLAERLLFNWVLKSR